MSARQFGGPEPQQPEASDLVNAWLDARFPGAIAWDALREAAKDAPPEVQAFVEAHDRWCDEMDAWCAKQPIARDPEDHGFRMFGGPAIGWKWGYEVQAAMDRLVESGASEVELLRFAGAVNEQVAIIRHASRLIERAERDAWALAEKLDP